MICLEPSKLLAERFGLVVQDLSQVARLRPQLCHFAVSEKIQSLPAAPFLANVYLTSSSRLLATETIGEIATRVQSGKGESPAHAHRQNGVIYGENVHASVLRAQRSAGSQSLSSSFAYHLQMDQITPTNKPC